MLETLKQAMKISVTALLKNKARSFLTMLGIIIGVGSVVMIIAIGAGAQSLILGQVQGLGSNLIGVAPGHAEEGEPPATIMGIVITTLKYEDAMALNDKRNVPNIVDVVAYSNGVGTLQWGPNSYSTDISGITTGYLSVEGGVVEDGRFFTEDEERSLARVAVLGSTVRDELFGESDAIGQRIKIKNQAFEVIGVMEERGVVAMQDYDVKVFIPISSMQTFISGVKHIGLIRAKVDFEQNIPKAIEDVKMTLRARHNIKDSSGKSDDFTVLNSVEALEMITTITDSLKYFLAAMAALSLIVGGIGIMNIMLVSVTERTREIGLRKAVGANTFNIMNQFLLEAVTVTLLGGIIGIIGGSILSFAVSSVVNYLGYDWAFSVSVFSIVLAVGVSTVVGLVFGLYPARKASLLEPIAALRYE